LPDTAASISQCVNRVESRYCLSRGGIPSPSAVVFKGAKSFEGFVLTRMPAAPEPD
jgi:hypothetical protein